MNSRLKKIGLLALIVGIILLIASLVFAFTIGTIAVPVCFISSLIVNTAGVMMLRHKSREDSQ